LSRLFAMLIATAFVLSAFIGIVPAAQAAANALNVSEILKAFDAQGIPLLDGTRTHTDLLSMNPNAPVVAILKLPGDPVAVVKSQMPDMQLSAAQKDAIKAELKARQDALIPTIESLGGRVVGQYQVAYNGIAIQIPRSKLAGLAQLNAVVSVSPVQAFSPAHTTTLPFLGVPQVWGGVPGFRGEGMKIAIIDTGIDSGHPAFQDSSLPMPDGFPKTNKSTDLAYTNGRIIVARAYTESAVENGPPALDVEGHGTGVAMTAAGGTVLGPFGLITGVAPKAYLGNYKVFPFPNQGAPDDLILQAINDAVADGMDVLNMSLGGIPASRPGDDPLVEAVENAVAAGRIVTIAAGNEGSDLNTIASPGTAPNAGRCRENPWRHRECGPRSACRAGSRGRETTASIPR